MFEATPAIGFFLCSGCRCPLCLDIANSCLLLYYYPKFHIELLLSGTKHNFASMPLIPTSFMTNARRVLLHHCARHLFKLQE